MSARAALGWPNRVSIARILLVGPFVICLLRPEADWPIAPRYVALAIFGLMAASDWLDGYLARRVGPQTLLGRFLDPLGDKLLITASVILLATVGVPAGAGAGTGGVDRLPWWLVFAVIGKDLLIIVGFIATSYLCGRIVIEPRTLGKACTVAQLVLIIALLLKPDLPAGLKGVAGVLIWVVAALVVAASVDYVRLGLRIVAATPPRQKEPT